MWPLHVHSPEFPVNPVLHAVVDIPLDHVRVV